MGACRALTVLDDRLLEVQLLQALNPVRPGSLPRTHRDGRAAQAINRASVVLLCSALEGFAEDLLFEALDAMTRHRVRVTAVAPYLKQRHAERQIKELAAVTDTRKFVAGLGGLLAANRELLGDGRLSEGSIEPERLRYGFASPSSAEMVKLFAMLGLTKSDLLDRSFASYRMRVHVIANIDSLVAVRTDVAHGGAGNVSVTQQDVTRYAGAVRMLGARLHAAVAGRLQSLGASPW